jgi:hypothetical protein
MIKKIVTILILLVVALTGCAKKPQGDYPAALTWDNIVYAMERTEVSKDELGEQLGEVKRVKEPMPLRNGDANNGPVGSRIFEIKGVDTKNKVAYEKDGKTYMAFKIGDLK